MKSDYRDSYGEIYVRIKNIIEKYNERCLSEGLPKDPSGLFSSGNLHMQSIAIGDYVVNKDIVSMKNRFYNAAKAKELLLKFFDAMKDARPTSRVSMITYDSLFEAIISDSKELMHSLASLMGGRGKLDSDGISTFAYHTGYVMKYLVLDNTEDVVKHVEAIDKLKKKPDLGYEKVFKAIIEKDEKMLDEGLRYLIDRHKTNKEYKGTPDELFSIPAVALAKLAKLKGIKVEIDDEIAPAEVIEKHEVNYELLDFLKMGENMLK